jgi:ubiquinone/menaquinone biosynthesis C-methylase UbiE
LDLQHAGFKLLLDGRLSLAPMSEVPATVLDIATGTGIWAIEYGK